MLLLSAPLLSTLACTTTLVVTPREPVEDESITGGAEADVLYDVAVLHEVEVTLDPAAWELLRVQDRSYYDLLGGGCMEGPWESPYTWFDAAVRIDGEDLGAVGVRKKGLLGSQSEERPSLRIDVDRVEADKRFHGLEKLVLNNNNQDPGRLRTCLAHHLFADAGLVAPRCALAHVTVNGEDLGIYSQTESIDEDLIGRQLGARPAQLYEGALSDFRDGWTATFEAETAESDGAILLDVTRAMAADDADLYAELDQHLDVDAFFTFWAAEGLAGHWDGYTGNTNNFYVYTHPDDGRLRFVASGPDAAFDSRDPFGASRPVATMSALAQRLWATDEGKARYTAEMERLLDEVWDEDARLAQLDAWQALVRPYSTSDLREGIVATEEVVANRAADLRAALGDDIDVDPLRGSICWEDHGDVIVTFETTWGSYPGGDVLSGGVVEATYMIDGTEYVATDHGVSVGFDESGAALWLIISTLAPDTYIAAYVVYDVGDTVDGAVLPIDGHGATAALMYNSADTGGAWQTVAYLAGGSLELDEASAETGATVRGRLTTDVVGSGG